MAVNVTLQIPNSVYRLAQITAKITSRPIEQVLSDVLAAANPLADDLPPALQAEIDALAQLNDTELRKVARSAYPAGKQRRYDLLLEKNSGGKISADEKKELKTLREESEHLTLRKAHAYALLKWRGHSLPSLQQLPNPR